MLNCRGLTLWLSLVLFLTILLHMHDSMQNNHISPYRISTLYICTVKQTLARSYRPPTQFRATNTCICFWHTMTVRSVNEMNSSANTLVPMRLATWKASSISTPMTAANGQKMKEHSIWTHMQIKRFVRLLRSYIFTIIICIVICSYNTCFNIYIYIYTFIYIFKFFSRLLNR